MLEILYPKYHVQAFRELISLLTRHRQLTLEMTKREISDRYMGQVFGTVWAVGHPLILMAVYVFVFTYIFSMKIGGTPDLPFSYAAYLMAGLIPWMGFQEAMNKSTTVVINNANLVKQIVFPIEILPVKGALSSLVTMVISFMVFIVYVILSYRMVHWTYVLLPALLLLQTLGMIGVSFVLASVGVYFRDMKDFVTVFNVVCFYAMPMCYLPSSVPKAVQFVLYLNPFSYLIWCYQDVLYFGRFEHPAAWVIFSTFSIGIFYVGYRIFRKLKTMFGNML